MPASYRSIKWDKGGLDRVLKEPGGVTGVYLSRLGGYITRQALIYTASRLHRRTGLYAASFRTTTIRVGGELRTVVTNTAPYATYLERGTRPHVIVPVRARFLVFQARDGRTVFTKKVNHPGTRPYRVLTDALRVGARLARL